MPVSQQRLLTAAQHTKGVAVSPRNQWDTVAEELTAKEHEVLGLLATRLSRREIGQRLYVSLNTVEDPPTPPAPVPQTGCGEPQRQHDLRPRARPALTHPATPPGAARSTKPIPHRRGGRTIPP